MTREELTYKLSKSTASNYILQLPTGYGKTKISLDKTKEWIGKDSKILIVVPRLNNMKEWKKEITKWGFDDILSMITFTTYVSFPKYCSPEIRWNTVIFDEGHHTSERCRDAMIGLNTQHIIVLSATLKKEHVDYFRRLSSMKIIKVNAKDAIESGVLPNPRIILIPLTLDNTVANCIIEKNIRKTTNPATIKVIGFSQKWEYRKYKGPLRITCTAQQYYSDCSNLIDWYKQKGMYNAVMKNIWLHKAGERLKWLAKHKENIIKDLLRQLRNYRVLTFCQSIEQSETLGCPCVNSKVGLASLDLFNSKRIKHIAAVEMLDEGANLAECKIGLFQMINSSQRMSLQRIGRILRHNEPVLIFPYWMHTREEEIINELIKGYDPELIVRVNTVGNIKNYI